MPPSLTARSSSGRRSSRPATSQAPRPAGCRSSGSSGRVASMPTTATSCPSPGWRRCGAGPPSGGHPHFPPANPPPRASFEFVPDLERRLAAPHPDARIASVGGRYYAMDRDRRWERTEIGYDAIVHGVGERAPSAVAAVEGAYGRGENDEFVRPTVVDGIDGGLRGGEAIVNLNFRADPARPLTHPLSEASFPA